MGMVPLALKRKGPTYLKLQEVIRVWKWCILQIKDASPRSLLGSTRWSSQSSMMSSGSVAQDADLMKSRENQAVSLVDNIRITKYRGRKWQGREEHYCEDIVLGSDNIRNH